MFSAAIKSGAAGSPTDPQFKYVTMLLHGDGTNGAQNNTFLDSSTNNFTITRNGNTTQGTFTPYGSNWSNYFDGTGDYLTAAANTAFVFGTGDFTVEAWIYATSWPTDAFVISNLSSGDTSWAIEVYGGNIRFTGWATVWLSATQPSTNAWHHVAVSRSGTTLSMFVDGTRVATASNSTNLSANNTFVVADYIPAGGANFAGYISNVRLVKGTAVYTGTSFTVPTSPLTAISGTSLLTCQSNRFIDNSTNNFTITKNGDTSVQRFSPFSPTSAYSTSVIGGSGYFDGTTDYLTASANVAFGFGTGDFTMECWIYPVSWVGLYDGFISTLNSVTAIGAHLSRDGVEVNGVATAWGVTLQLNTWTHLALTRSGTSLRLFVNGAITNTATNSANLGVLSAFAAGRRLEDVSNYYCNSYISNARIVKGTAVYTAAFTPSTAPLTSISGTSILLSATNAGILDNAMMNDLETVGNAQISTSVKKYGTGSVAFDGSGDGLIYKASPLMAFGTGDFTIEFWVYLNANQSNFTKYLTTGNSSGNLVLGQQGTANQICVDDNASVLLSSSSNLSNTTWTHVALVRSGTTLTMYFNGTSVGSTSNSTNWSAGTGSVGSNNAGAQSLNGYIDDLRITKGYARYTANFTPPTAAFPNN